VLSDEIYRAISYEAEATSLLSVRYRVGAPGGSVDGCLAKSFAMTGLAYRLVDRSSVRLARAMDGAPVAYDVEWRRRSPNTPRLARFSPTVGARAPRRSVDMMVGRSSDAGAILGLALLCDAGMDVNRTARRVLPLHPTWATPRQATRSRERAFFARRLLEEADVAVVPGAAFRSPEWNSGIVCRARRSGHGGGAGGSLPARIS